MKRLKEFLAKPIDFVPSCTAPACRWSPDTRTRHTKSRQPRLLRGGRSMNSTSCSYRCLLPLSNLIQAPECILPKSHILSQLCVSYFIVPFLAVWYCCYNISRERPMTSLSSLMAVGQESPRWRQQKGFSEVREPKNTFLCVEALVFRHDSFQHNMMTFTETNVKILVSALFIVLCQNADHFLAC